MVLLDSVVPATDDGEGSNADVLARDLNRFGKAAKQELLNRAVGTNPGWRNVAGAILGEWKSWTPFDVPKLREALQKDPGGWVAGPLGRIGTPEAIQALVADLPNGSESQTGFALSHLGAKVIPYLFPLLENPEQAQPAANVIREIGKPAISFANGWAVLANDPQKPLNARLAALRGMAAIGPQARAACISIHPLLTANDPTLRAQVKATLRAVRDPAIATELAQSCEPTASEFDPLAFESAMCLREIAAYGNGARDAAHLLLPFLKSQNAIERADAITVFGMTGYEPAVPQIEMELSSQDWRVMYSAIRSLGWLKDGAATAKIEELSSAFWLPEVRDLGVKTGAALRSPKGGVDPPAADSMDLAEGPFEIDRHLLGKVAPCPSHRWRWKDTRFETPTGDERSEKSLALWDGTLSGTDRGEFIGELTWRKGTAAPISLLKDNVTALARTSDGNAIALFGLSHMGFNYGYVLRVVRSGEDVFHLSEIADLPAQGDGLVSFGTDLFAVESAGRLVFFTEDRGILGLATCQ